MDDRKEKMGRLIQIVTAMCESPWQVKDAEERGLLYVLERTEQFTTVRPFRVVNGIPTFQRRDREDDKIIVPTSEQDPMELCKLYNAIASEYECLPGREDIRFEPTPHELHSRIVFARSDCICSPGCYPHMVDAALKLLPYAPVFISLNLSGEMPEYTREFLKLPTTECTALASLVTGSVDERVARFTQMYLDSRKLNRAEHGRLQLIPYFSKNSAHAGTDEWKEILAQVP